MNIFEEAAGTGRKTSKASKSDRGTRARSTDKATKAKAKSTSTKSKKCKGGHDDAGRAVTDTMMPMMGLGLGMAMMDGLFN